MHWFAGAIFYIKAEFGRKANDAQHTHRVFTKPCRGIPHNANNALLYIVQTLGKIMDAVIAWIIVHGVYGQITATGIIIQTAKYIIAGKHAAIGLLAMVLSFVVRFGFIGAECRNFNNLTAKLHMHNLKATANNTRASK